MLYSSLLYTVQHNTRWIVAPYKNDPRPSAFSLWTSTAVSLSVLTMGLSRKSHNKSKKEKKKRGGKKQEGKSIMSPLSSLCVLLAVILVYYAMYNFIMSRVSVGMYTWHYSNPHRTGNTRDHLDGTSRTQSGVSCVWAHLLLLHAHTIVRPLPATCFFLFFILFSFVYARRFCLACVFFIFFSILCTPTKKKWNKKKWKRNYAIDDIVQNIM